MKSIFRTSTIFSLSIFTASCGSGPAQNSVHVRAGDEIPSAKVYYLPRGIVKLEFKSDGNTVTVAAPTAEIIPDSRAQFAALWNEASSAEDKFTFAINSKGLLTSVSSINEDKIPEIIQKIADIAKEAGKGLIPFSAPSGLAAQPPKFDIRKTIDPFCSEKKCNSSASNEFFDVSFRKMNGNRISRLTDAEIDALADDCIAAICLRVPVPIKVRVTSTRALEQSIPVHIDNEFVVMLPDPSSVVRFEIERGPCIKRQTDLTFESGMLTKAELTKPSEILECLEIPLSIAKAIAEIPGAILTAKIKLMQDERAIVSEQAAYYREIRTLLDNQYALLAALAKK
ncbi:hypothetical protein [Methylocystis rosea]|uniref:Uncharacterized protein n=1 Tax=Methylocystis rosea TaxID=173366 RepID=A0A3G8M9V4_9HYPH|nr:hypothetical protein [Methylocystis rosea]AZG77992.1 hypothetical protein EHO51_15300 [Methylocystis rosea]